MKMHKRASQNIIQLKSIITKLKIMKFILKIKVIILSLQFKHNKTIMQTYKIKNCNNKIILIYQSKLEIHKIQITTKLLLILH